MICTSYHTLTQSPCLRYCLFSFEASESVPILAALYEKFYNFSRFSPLLCSLYRYTWNQNSFFSVLTPLFILAGSWVTSIQLSS